MGAVHSVAVILALIAWFGSLVALVVLPIQLLRARRAEQHFEQPYEQPYAPRPRVRTLDRFRAAARRLSWGPRNANRLPGISREQTAYRPAPPSPNPMPRRGPRPPDDMPRRAWRPDAHYPQRQPLWPPDPDPDPERRYHTLLSATAVRPRPDGRTPPRQGGRNQPPPPRNSRVPYEG